MRLKLIFGLRDDVISIDYRRKFISFFKKALEDAGGGAKERYFGDNLQIKDYTFSVYFSGQFKGKIIQIKNKEIILNFSIVDMKDGIYFMNAFIGAIHKKFNFGVENELTLNNVKMHNEKELQGNEGEVRILSPIVVKERDNEEVHGKRKNRDIYYIYKDSEWINVLKANMKFQLKDKFEYDISHDINNLEIIAKEPFVKKTVVENYGAKFQVTLGRMYLKGSKDLLEYLLKSGIGSKRASGFGMLELL